MSNLTCFRIFNVNYADYNLLPNVDYSSEQVDFPVSNIFNWQRRSKVWRSDGYFRVTNNNSRLIFRESTGVDLTAVLSIGEYTKTTLCAAIKSAMEVIGDSTYTVTYDTTYLKFRLQSNGVGGTGIFELVKTGSTLANSIGLVADMSGALDYYMDDITIHGDDGEWILLDMGISTNPDAVIMIDRKQISLQITPQAVVKIQGNTTTNFDNPEYSQTLDYDDEVLSYISDTGMSASSYRYWRVQIYDPRNPNGYIQLGSLFVGNFMSPSRGRAQFPLQQQYIDQSTTNYSEGGVGFSDNKFKTQSFNVSMFAYQKADIEELDTFFFEYGTTKSFFVSMDTTEAYSTDYHRRIIFCKFSDSPQWTLTRPDIFEVSMSFREEL
jgi:hypothetical protein